jgi:hypothetical protein
VGIVTWSEPMMNLSDLNVKVFAAGADKAAMLELYNNDRARVHNESDAHAAGGCF